MTATVGTTTAFNMTIDEIISFVLEGIGGEHISAKEAKNARTALNLMFIDLQNKGFAPLASMEVTEVPLVSGSSMGYSFGSDVFTVLDSVVQVSSASGTYVDLGIETITYDDWLNIPTKLQNQGRPSQMLILRGRDDTTFNVWPVPNNNNYKVKSWTLKKIADVNKSHQLVDLPTRYLPSVVAGLRYYMAWLRPGTLMEDKVALKQEYIELLDNAMSEDRERVGIHFYPNTAHQLGS